MVQRTREDDATGEDGGKITEESGEQEWLTERDRSEAPVALGDVRALFVLDGTCYFVEQDEGVVYGRLIGAKDWSGPEPKHHPNPEEADGAGGYSVVTPAGDVRIAERDVQEIRTVRSFIGDASHNVERP